MLTPEIIKSFAPRARQDYIDALVNGSPTLQKYGINTPMRLAQFLATVCHETGGLTIVRENGNYSASRIRQVWPTRTEAVKFAGNAKGLFNSVYGSRMGNQRNGVNDDDGWLFRGGSMMQTTGRDNYERLEKETGLPFASVPETIEKAEAGLVAACHEFAPLVKYCDKGEAGFRAVCNAINRGNALSSLDPIGWVDRQMWLKKCTDALGACVAVEDVLEIGDHGALVKAFQERLTALGYPVGKVDGAYGSRTRAAVLAFQAENGIATDGRIGPQTRSALNSENAKAMPLGERVLDTKEGLKAQGDPTLKATDAVKTTVKAIGTTASSFVIADQTGLLDSAGTLLQDMSQFKGVASGMAEVLHWAVTHWYYLVPLGCYLIYRWVKTVEGQKMLNHWRGLDLSEPAKTKS